MKNSNSIRLIKLLALSTVLIASTFLSSCGFDVVANGCRLNDGFDCNHRTQQKMSSTSEMEQAVNNLNNTDINPANLYLDYSGSNVGSVKASSNPSVNLILKNGSTIVDTLSTPLSLNNSRTRLYLSNPTAVSNFVDLNTGYFDEIEIEVDGVKFDMHNGNNLILAEIIHYGSPVLGSSYSYYSNGGGSGGGHNQQQ